MNNKKAMRQKEIYSCMWMKILIKMFENLYEKVTYENQDCYQMYKRY